MTDVQSTLGKRVRGPVASAVILLARILLELAAMIGLLSICAGEVTIGVIIVAILIVVGSEVLGQ